MIPSNYARQIASLDGGASEFLLEIEKIIHKALADEDCRLAALIDQHSLKKKIQFPSQCAELCREQAAFHEYFTDEERTCKGQESHDF
jgi:hypothetical protein